MHMFIYIFAIIYTNLSVYYIFSFFCVIHNKIKPGYPIMLFILVSSAIISTIYSYICSVLQHTDRNIQSKVVIYTKLLRHNYDTTDIFQISQYGLSSPDIAISLLNYMYVHVIKSNIDQLSTLAVFLIISKVFYLI